MTFARPLTTRLAQLAVVVCLTALSNSPAMAQTLSSSEFSALKKRFSSALKVKSIREATSALHDLAMDNSKRAAKFLLEAAVKIDDQRIYLAARRGLEQIDAPDAQQEMADKLRRGAADWRIRVLLCDVLSSQDTELASTALIGALNDKNESVRRAAIDALDERRDHAVVSALVAALVKEEGRTKGGSDLMRHQLRKALKELTGEDFPKGADWKNFWEPRASNFNFAQVSHKAKSDAGVETVERRPRFFGSEIHSNRIVFVIDVSGSMQVEDPPSRGGTEDPTNAPRPQTGEGADDGSPPPADPRVKSRIRIDRAKGNLIGALKGLPKDARFTVIAYSGMGQMGQPLTPDQFKQSILVWQPKLMAAGSGTIGKAVSFVEKFQANGATFTMRALETAFQVKGADTIILLSDGMPTEMTKDGQQQVSPGMILKRVKELNKFRRVTIHTFGFDSTRRPAPGGMGGPPPGGGGGLSEFMRELAKQNGGDYKPIR